MPNTEHFRFHEGDIWLLLLFLFCLAVWLLASPDSGQCSKANEWTNKSIFNAFSDKYLNEQWILVEWDIQ